jgi:hypothetical protein
VCMVLATHNSGDGVGGGDARGAGLHGRSASLRSICSRSMANGVAPRGSASSPNAWVVIRWSALSRPRLPVENSARGVGGLELGQIEQHQRELLSLEDLRKASLSRSRVKAATSLWIRRNAFRRPPTSTGPSFRSYGPHRYDLGRASCYRGSPRGARVPDGSKIVRAISISSIPLCHQIACQYGCQSFLPLDHPRSAQRLPPP